MVQNPWVKYRHRLSNTAQINAIAAINRGKCMVVVVASFKTGESTGGFLENIKLSVFFNGYDTPIRIVVVMIIHELHVIMKKA